MLSILFGRVAQLVEQGTENPCVGGSSPPSATFLLISLISTGCQTDKCKRLCTEIEITVSECMDDWPVEWEHLDASSASEFGESCQNQWITLSESMEIRERQQAQEQCQQTIVEIRLEDDPCELLRGIYFYDP
jgi:hypothetical protein